MKKYLLLVALVIAPVAAMGAQWPVPAEAQPLPTPRPTPHPEVNPAPQPPAPVIVNTPDVKPVFNLPAQGEGLLSWIQTTFLGLIAALFGINTTKMAFFPSHGSGTSVTNDSDKIKQIIAAIAHPNGADVGVNLLGDPKLRQIALQIVQSGVPGTLIQGGLSMIPGAGPFVSKLEPMLREIIIDALDKRLGTERPTGSSPTSLITPDLVTGIESIVKNAIEKHFKPGA